MSTEDVRFVMSRDQLASTLLTQVVKINALLSTNLLLQAHVLAALEKTDPGPLGEYWITVADNLAVEIGKRIGAGTLHDPVAPDPKDGRAE